MIYFLFVLLVLGFVFGAIARLLVPGPDSMSFFGTWMLGVAGSFVGGFLGALLFGFDAEDGLVQLGGVVGSIVGSVIILVVRRVLTRTGQASRNPVRN
jgi:uncharacterized membrane protein YeaQ/YmgE (transglycosylase-associated protein family)